MGRAGGWGIARAWLVALLVVMAALASAGPAAAQSADEGLESDDQIVLNGRLVVPDGETVGMAVIFHGPAVIEGTVREGVVVFNGSAEISGSVADNVVVFSGDLIVRSGAEVGGDLVSQSTPEVEDGATVRGSTQSVATRFDFEGVGFASRFVWWIWYSVSSLVLGLVLLLLFPALDPTTITAWRERTGESIGWGVGLFFLVPLAAILLLVTVVALPLGAFVLLGLGLLYTVGYVVGAAVLGRLVVRPPTSRFLAFLVGWLIARAFGLIPVVGGIAWLLASVVGLGVLFVIARRQRGEASRSAIAPPPPVPA